MQVAGQTAVSYSYDNADRLTSVTQGGATVTLTYDNADRRSTLTLPNGIIVEYGYDDDSRLTGLTYKYGSSPIGTLTYGYDASGQRSTVGGTWARTNLPAALASATYDDANQIVTFGGTSFTYDDNGNLMSDGVRSYTWNARNQLASLSGPVNASFAYDGVGRRRAKAIGGTTTQFLYDGLNPVQELMSGVPTANLLTGLNIDEYFTRTDGAGVRSFLTDALSSSIALADTSGDIQTNYTYEPFGLTSLSGASTSNSFAFTGRELDATGLLYYRARYLATEHARFISADPLRESGSGDNTYRYAQDNPISLVDPLGLSVKNCTDEPITVKPEEAGKPPVVVPPMTEWIGYADGVSRQPNGPWVKVPGRSPWRRTTLCIRRRQANRRMSSAHSHQSADTGQTNRLSPNREVAQKPG